MAGITDYGTFVLTLILFFLVPGPGNLALIISTSKGGIRGGLAAGLGLTLGDQCLLWLALAGLAAVLAAHPTVFHGVQYLGALYLGWLGFRMLFARRVNPDTPPTSILQIRPRHYFRQALVITLLNPKAIVFYMAFFPLFIDPTRQQGMVTFSILATTVAFVGFAYNVVVVLCVHFFAQRVRANPKAKWALEKLAGFCLIGFGIRMAVAFK